MSWFLIILFLNLSFNGCFPEARIEKEKLPSAAPVVVVGTVVCDTCFQHDFTKSNHFISGATVSVECKDGKSEKGFKSQVKTNKKGKFKVILPFSVTKHVKKIEGCSVKLIKSSEPYCSVASSASSSSSSSSFHLKTRKKKGIHIFSAGFFTFKPLKQPSLCTQNSIKTFLPPFNSPAPALTSPVQPPALPNIPNLPPVTPMFPPLAPLAPLPPLPQLPGLPPLPPLPLLTPPSYPNPSSGKINTEFLFPPILPPNPLQPPPLIPNPLQPPTPLIPNPLQPPPAPIIPNPFQPPPTPLIPNPFQPPSGPLIPFPPVAFFTPPPPPPSLFPPLPLPPLPRVPGFPPIPPSKKSSTSEEKNL